jgi:putative transposase
MNNTLNPGVIYHIYNRGNNRENIFREERNYNFFLKLYTRHISLVAETYAYCLLKNHFHLLIRVNEAPVGVEASQKFSNFFNAYSKAFNLAYQRTGALFQRPFKRIPVIRDHHFLALIAYIHYNPQMHGFVDDFRAWPYSSYQVFQSEETKCLTLHQVLDSFGGLKSFLEYHTVENLKIFGNWSGLEDQT